MPRARGARSCVLGAGGPLDAQCAGACSPGSAFLFMGQDGARSAGHGSPIPGPGELLLAPDTAPPLSADAPPTGGGAGFAFVAPTVQCSQGHGVAEHDAASQFASGSVAAPRWPCRRVAVKPFHFRRATTAP